MSDRHEVVEQLLGPRYVWAVHTEPVRRLIAYIRTLEEKVGEVQHVKPCECPTIATDYHATPDASQCEMKGDLEVVVLPESWERVTWEIKHG